MKRFKFTYIEIRTLEQDIIADTEEEAFKVFNTGEGKVTVPKEISKQVYVTPKATKVEEYKGD